MRPHVLGIDDAPFTKGKDLSAPLVAVMMEGATLVDGVAVNRMKIDDPEATQFLIDWIRELRWTPSLQAIVFGGITIAGLGLLHLPTLARELNLPVITVTRQDTHDSTLDSALIAAGLSERLSVLNDNPSSVEIDTGIFASFCGITQTEAKKLIRSTLQKSTMPEPLRIAHLIGAALVNGESKGRV
ncbi:MAG TPA: DUF99 family protein [Balneolales bacterium]|nr:DUF99 family protein [Balneolales bacterium]